MVWIKLNFLVWSAILLMLGVAQIATKHMLLVASPIAAALAFLTAAFFALRYAYLFGVFREAERRGEQHAGRHLQVIVAVLGLIIVSLQIVRILELGWQVWHGEFPTP